MERELEEQEQAFLMAANIFAQTSFDGQFTEQEAIDSVTHIIKEYYFREIMSLEHKENDPVRSLST